MQSFISMSYAFSLYTLDFKRSKKKNKTYIKIATMAHTFDPRTVEAKKGRDFCEFQMSLVYTVSSRTTRPTQ